MTLVLLSLAGITLEMTVRQSLQRTLDARQAHTDLQHQWAARSCSRVLLEQSDTLLDTLNADSPHPTSSHRITLTLSNREIQLLLCDEQAKANVNNIYRQRGKENTTHLLRRILSSSAQSIALSPLHLASDDKTDPLPQFGTFNQVFPQATPEHLAFTPRHTAALSSNLTFWTDGTINYRTASAAALHAATPTLTMDLANRLVTLRQDQPGLGLDDLLLELDLDQESIQTIKPRLTDSSNCRSLWIAWPDQHRTHYRLDVQRAEADGKTTHFRFTW